MKEQNVFVRFVIKFSQAISHSSTRINGLIEGATLLLSHLLRIAVIFTLSNLSAIPQGKLYGAIGHVLRVFQVGFWTEITPMTYADFGICFFAIVLLEIVVLLGFLSLVWKKQAIPPLMELTMAFQILIINRYLLYIPLYQSSFYVIFNQKSEAFFYTVAIFNIVVMTTFKVFFYIISYRPAYSNFKYLAQYQNREVGEMIWFLIILGIRMSDNNASSMTTTYLMFSLTCTHLIVSVFHPRYLLSSLNRLDLFCHCFTFGFTLVLILQATAYDSSKMEFPFLLLTSFLYWFMTNIDGYRKGKVFDLFVQKTHASLTMKYLPFIYEEFIQVNTVNGKLIEAIYPLLANLSDNEKGIFSSEDCFLESLPMKHIANKVFINFISKKYEEYFKSSDVYRSGVQSTILAYLFFVRFILQDNLKVLFLIHDFRRKLKAKNLSFGWKLAIQVARLEESRTQEYFSSKSENALDTSRVFDALKNTEELAHRMNSWTQRKIEFLEDLKATTVNLQVVKEKGIGLVEDSKAIFAYVRQQKDLLKFSKTQHAIEFFIEEILQDPDYLTFDLKVIKKTASHHHASKLDFESLDTLKVIDKLQTNRKHPVFLFAAEDFSGISGKITHNTEYLIQKLGYTQSELHNVKWEDLLVAIDKNQRSAKNNDDSSGFRKDENSIHGTVHQAIIRNRNNTFIAIKSTLQLDIIDDVPSIVLLGQEEPTYHQNFLLCKLDGTIEGTSKNFAETVADPTKFRGKKIQEILILNRPSDMNFTDNDGSTTVVKGKLILTKTSSTNPLENEKEASFLITQFDHANPSKDGYYLISIYEKKITSLFEKRNTFKASHTLELAAQMEIKMAAPQGQETKRSQFPETKRSQFPIATSVDNMPIKTGDSKDVLPVPGEEYSLYQLLTSKEQRSRPLPLKIDFNRLDSLEQHSNWIEKHEIITGREQTPMHSQEFKAGARANFLSSDNFVEQVSMSLTHHSGENDTGRELTKKRELNKNQRASSMGSSITEETIQKRALERIKRNLKSHFVPLEFQSITILQIVISLGLIAYLLGDYFDLYKRYIILSELSGLTSFPIILFRNIYVFFQVQELLFSSLNQLWLPATRASYLTNTPRVFVKNAFDDFNAKYYEHVLQANPETHYSDFRYDNYTINLSLPDTPYLSRVVDFHEALDVLRGYLQDVYTAAFDGSYIHKGALEFFRAQILNYGRMLFTLSEDLFSRINQQFDQLFQELQLRVLVGAAAALLVGISVCYIFLRLYYHSDRLLSKMATISGSELTEEINRLEKKAIILIGAEYTPLEEKGSRVVKKKEFSKDPHTRYSVSKKYISLRKGVLSKLAFIVFLVGMYLIPSLVGFSVKEAPVSNCLPLLSQYKIIVSNAMNAIGDSSQVIGAISLAGTGNANQSSKLLKTTESFLNRTITDIAALSNFLNNKDAVKENRYISSNLTTAIAALRNSSYCDYTYPGLSSSCKSTTKGLASMGMASVRQKTIEWAVNFRSQLIDSNFDAAFATTLTHGSTLSELAVHGAVASIALGNITEIYIENFKEIATAADSSLLVILIVSLICYVLLLFVFLFPFLSRAGKQYMEIKEIYTLLPAHSLLMNPYINNMLKGRDRL